MSERAFLIGTTSSRKERSIHEESLKELERLADTAGAVVVGQRLYELGRIDPATFIGRGRVEALAEKVPLERIDLLIFDDDLSPGQNRNIEKICGVKVIDRTGLILDIFARRARSQEGKIQVELAQLRYLLPRLVGRGEELSRLAGGIGTRGPGETKLEIDRRRARERVASLKEDLQRLRSRRSIHRAKRAGVPIPLVSLIGYTNAGKSTLMNRLTEAGLFVEDKLFATLDPTVRRLKLPSGREILIADTVGFVRKLPHQLVEAFQTTFEEVGASELLLHLIDVSHPDAALQVQTVQSVLRELELSHKPILRVLNKIDRAAAADLFEGLPVSALRGDGIPALLEAMDEILSSSFRKVSLLLPHGTGSELSLLYRTSRVLKRRDTSKGVRLLVEVDEKYFNKFRDYVV